MWRRNRFPGNQDSDESISDEEEPEFGCSERRVSMDGPSKKEEPDLALQFELLRGAIEANEKRKHTADEKIAGFSSEDEVEMPIFHNTGDLDGEKNNDEMPNIGHEKQLEDCMWSAVYRGTDRSVQLSENVDTFQVQPAKCGGKSFTEEEDLDSPEPPLLAESLLPIEYKSLETAAADRVEGFQGKYVGKSVNALTAEGTSGHDNAKYSMADLLDGLQEKNCGQYAIPKMVGRRGKRGRASVNVYTSMKEKSIVNNEDPCEIIGSGSSSDDDAKVQNRGLTTTEAKRKTMADQFQEAFGATSMNEGTLLAMPKQSSGGLLGKLQRVIQREKEQDLEFLKNLRSESLRDEAGYIDVEILSRSFEAKLTVCLCSIHGYKRSSVSTEKSEEDTLMNTRTVIFNSRACGDVELDAGTFIRVYPPWKEVQVAEGDNIILALYFTHIET